MIVDTGFNGIPLNVEKQDVFTCWWLEGESGDHQTRQWNNEWAFKECRQLIKED